MSTRTKVVLAAALMLGTASVALAGDSGENSFGGSVMPGSMVGVNPAYHPGWFPDYPRNNTAGASYGYVAPKPTHRHVQTQDR
jgi:hypothetical protein